MLRLKGENGFNVLLILRFKSSFNLLLLLLSYKEKRKIGLWFIKNLSVDYIFFPKKPKQNSWKYIQLKIGVS